jgi:hypothetical protein
MSSPAQIDLNIAFTQNINLATGIPYADNGMRIPEEYRGLSLKRGTHWFAYIKPHFRPVAPGLQRAFGPDGSRSAGEFYDLYPAWDQVSNHLGHHPDPDWDEKMHDLFLAVLNWLRGHEGFSVCWAYNNPLSDVFNNITFVHS